MRDSVWNIFPLAGKMAAYRSSNIASRLRLAIAIFSWLPHPALIRSRREGRRCREQDHLPHPPFRRDGRAAAGRFRRRLRLWASSRSSRTCRTAKSSTYPSAAEEAELANSAGLGFRHVPAIKSEVFSDRVVDGSGPGAGELEGPVLAHCASGLRSAIAWAAAAARSQPADCVIAALKNAGFDLAALRDELEDQRGRAHAASTPAALDCHCEEQGESIA